MAESNQKAHIHLCVYRGVDRFELRSLNLQSRHSTLEPYLQSIFLWLFWTQGHMNYLARLATSSSMESLSYHLVEKYLLSELRLQTGHGDSHLES
jgi:hypothetical protein